MAVTQTPCESSTATDTSQCLGRRTAPLQPGAGLLPVRPGLPGIEILQPRRCNLRGDMHPLERLPEAGGRSPTAGRLTAQELIYPEG